MKQLLIFLLFGLCTRCAIAQKLYDREFKPFKVNISPGYAMPQTSGSKGGLLVAVEPKYALLDQFSLGLRLEAAMLPAKDTSDISGRQSQANGSLVQEQNQQIPDISGRQSQANTSAVLTGDYYFNNNSFRPFLGGGFGLYSMVNEIGKDEGDLLSNATFANRFGFMIRSGFEWGHLRAGLEYNLVSSETNEVKNGYFGVKLGVVLGGGRFNLISENYEY